MLSQSSLTNYHSRNECMKLYHSSMGAIHVWHWHSVTMATQIYLKYLCMYMLLILLIYSYAYK